MGQTTPPPRAAAVEIYPMTPDAGDDELAAGARPAQLREPLLQAGLERHGGIGYELVLSTTVPQVMEDDVQDLLPTSLHARHEGRKGGGQ